jgi:hypothetical protein
VYHYGDWGVRTEGSDLLSVLDQLDTDTLSDSRVGLLGLDTDLLEDDSLGVGGATERGGPVIQTLELGPLFIRKIENHILERSAEGTLLVCQVRPFLVLPVHAQLTSRIETTGLSSRHDC